jgi:methylmalonyl-CoA mutase
MAKMRSEESATRKQGRIDSGEGVVVGVNKYRPTKSESVEVRSIDNAAVRKSQTDKLNKMKAARDEGKCKAALAALSSSAALSTSTGPGTNPNNLLKLAVDAARARATTGEISLALEGVWGRHVATSQVVQGAYKATYSASGDAAAGEFTAVQKEVEAFAAAAGRRPRILVAKMGQDGHDRGAKVISSGFSDLGFDVDVGPLFSTPEEVARQAVDADVHVVGVSSQAAGHRTLVPALVQALEAAGGKQIKIVVGGVIPPQDYKELLDAGAVAVFGPGTRVTDAAKQVLKAIA